MTKTLRMETMEILENAVDIGYPLSKVINDVLQNGCISGVVPELIYYHQTESFYDRHEEEINDLIQNISFEIYGSPSRIYSELELINDKNSMTWLAFEETVASIAYDLGI